MSAVFRSSRFPFAGLMRYGVALLLAAPLTEMAGAQTANDGFDPEVDANVSTSVVQPDGKVLVAGAFSSVDGLPRTFVARLNVDGSVDSGFVPPPIVGSYVRELALQPDGAVLIAGDFSAVGGAPHANIARLHADGSVDAAFAPSDPGAVDVLLRQDDGKVIVGGAAGIRRLQTSGTLDPTFNATVNGGVASADIQPDGSVVIGGTFNNVNGQLRPNIARLNADGSLDAGFTPSLGGAWPRVIKVLPNRTTLLGGFFDVYPPFMPRTYVVRLNATGTVDATFAVTGPQPPNGEVHSLAIQADGHVLIGGTFNSVAGVARHHVARLNPDGALDTAFDPDVDGDVQALTMQPDGSVLIGGAFATVNGQGRPHLARVSATGALDDTLLNGASGQVLALAQQSNGRVLVGGLFTNLGGAPRNRLARLMEDGRMDLTFDPGADGTVLALAQQPNGQIVLGGFFTHVDGQLHNRIARVSEAGVVDTGFNASIEGSSSTVAGIAVESDDALIVTGRFQSVNGVTRNRIARLRGDGSVDPNYDPNANDVVGPAALLGNGRLIVGGNFTLIGGQPRNRLARLDFNGAVDPAYNPGADAQPLVLALQPDGKLIVGGSFTVIAGVPHPHLARLNADGSLDAGFVADADGPVYTLALQADGRILVGGDFNTISGQSRHGVALLTANGSVVSEFDAHVTGEVDALLLQTDGKLVVGGGFNNIGSQWRNNLARLGATQAAGQSIDIVGAEVTLRRSGSAPEFSRPPELELSGDGINFDPMGPMHFASDAWAATLFAPESALGYPFYFRVRGAHNSGLYGGSGALIDSVWRFDRGIPEFIFVDGFE